ncbi:Deoxymugineic acid synthase 1 [Camellia lanceoleosa]|uniref:Deoxymugineic acid synthase 1 n=1 Tax=Camellia lanceoleosa TaxID=1840588 RepID=A0ACC0I681_9ERIC|nr:Deoxymugineic acid synthase 1 [Camellia lanceoleosa]
MGSIPEVRLGSTNATMPVVGFGTTAWPIGGGEPSLAAKEVKEILRKKGIHVTAYSPLGARGTRWGTNRVMDCETLKEIADAKGKTVAQVCLRWVYEQGVSVLVKSFNKERIKENLDIFDWMLSPEESQKIDRIPQQKVSWTPVHIRPRPL